LSKLNRPQHRTKRKTAKYLRIEMIIHLLCVVALAIAITPGSALADPSEEAGSTPLHPSYIDAKAAIDQQRYAEALPLLRQALAQNSGDANAHNLLGFVFRKTGNLDAAFEHYSTALRLDPDHRGAHEYIGEAYLMVNNLAKAEEHLRELDRLCMLPCEEYIDLQKAVEMYKAGRRS
jgi:tetratricopeptide (TPR) repeat protein